MTFGSVQAQKLISLFGWEPHVLPYKVDLDLKDGENQSVKDANVMVTTGQKRKVSIYRLSTGDDMKASAELQFDPSSVVLDCNLCGASVGLWAFSTIPRPLEYLRFIGLTEVNGRNISTDYEVCSQEGSSGNQIHTGNREGITNTVTTASTSLGFTIAGGPPPAMLNYGATISLPIIGHNLRARISTETETNDLLAVQKPSQVEEDQQMSLESENVTAEGTVATRGLDFIAKNPAEVPQTVPEGSISNVNLIENLRTINSADHHRFDAENNVLSREDGGNEPKRKEMDEPSNCEQGGSSYPSNHPDSPGIGPFAKHIPTLSALEGNKELNNVPASDLIEVDDPVASVKKLFTSPNDKRTKVAGGS
ncbi:UNVERIFIED_CONTAM: hypothetical protein Slati_3424100 [Sesamum latifolium]|uniref:Uncharacterized protein n=1 Tax=Sesamum latifolium TaxID=2727402 RepID=A0AAW2UHT7_9LAMI